MQQMSNTPHTIEQYHEVNQAWLQTVAARLNSEVASQLLSTLTICDPILVAGFGNEQSERQTLVQVKKALSSLKQHDNEKKRMVVARLVLSALALDKIDSFYCPKRHPGARRAMLSFTALNPHVFDAPVWLAPCMAQGPTTSALAYVHQQGYLKLREQKAELLKKILVSNVLTTQEYSLLKKFL